MTEKPCSSGPFPVRLWFDEVEFEDLADETLRQHGLFPEEPGPINVELLVDLEFGFNYHFEKLPPKQLGKITFGEKGPVELVLNTKLDNHRRRRIDQICGSSGFLVGWV